MNERVLFTVASMYTVNNISDSRIIDARLRILVASL